MTESTIQGTAGAGARQEPNVLIAPTLYALHELAHRCEAAEARVRELEAQPLEAPPNAFRCSCRHLVARTQLRCEYCAPARPEPLPQDVEELAKHLRFIFASTPPAIEASWDSFSEPGKDAYRAMARYVLSRQPNAVTVYVEDVVENWKLRASPGYEADAVRLACRAAGLTHRPAAPAAPKPPQSFEEWWQYCSLAGDGEGIHEHMRVAARAAWNAAREAGRGA